MEFMPFDPTRDMGFFELSEIESHKVTHRGEAMPQELLESRKEDVQRFAVSDDKFVRILREGDVPCGIILAGVARQGEQSFGFIYHVYISPEYRRRGYGREAMRRALQFCKERHCASIRLNVGAKNSAAISMYEGMGFESTGIAMELS